jgi:hypothetical protein
VVPGRKYLPPVRGKAYQAFVDISGGGADEPVLAIAHLDPRANNAVADRIVTQLGS